MAATLYLIPTLMGESDVDYAIPCKNSEIIKQLKFFVVEEIRSARRFLRQIDRTFDIDSSVFFVLNEHTPETELQEMIRCLQQNDVGLMSEAGCPGVADPGSNLIALAHKHNILVKPLVGPSSILLALMASGFNGQGFVFHGYLPIKPAERVKAIQELERKAFKENQTQIFIETPYRNLQMLDDLTKTLSGETRLCSATDLTTATELIVSKPIKFWKRPFPEINKRPTVFLIYK